MLMLSLRDARRCRALFPPLKRRAGLVPSLRDGRQRTRRKAKRAKVTSRTGNGHGPLCVRQGDGGGGATRTLDLKIIGLRRVATDL